LKPTPLEQVGRSSETLKKHKRNCSRINIIVTKPCTIRKEQHRFIGTKIKKGTP
jgi:hypothetical protein